MPNCCCTIPQAASARPCSRCTLCRASSKDVMTSAPPATRSNTGSSRHSSAVASAVRSSAPSAWNLGNAATRSSATSSPPTTARNPASRSRTSVVCNRSRPVTLKGTPRSINCSTSSLRFLWFRYRTAKSRHGRPPSPRRRTISRATKLASEAVSSHPRICTKGTGFGSAFVRLCCSGVRTHRSPPGNSTLVISGLRSITEYAERRMKSVERRFSAMVTRLTRATPKVRRK